MKLPPNVRGVGEAFRVVREISLRAASSDDGNGYLEGIGNKIGELDSYWTVSHPRSRAFTKAGCDETTAKGMLLQGHRSSEGPIGWIDSVKVSGRDYKLKCPYHSDPESQRFRTIAVERDQNGKEIGLSIGFTVSQYEWFEDGKEMVAALRERNEDMTLFNVSQLEAHERDCWLMYIERVYEVSQVCFQSNEPSVATSVRGIGEAPQTIEAMMQALATTGVKVTLEKLAELARDAGVLEEEAPGGGETDRTEEPPAEDPPAVGALASTEEAMRGIEKLLNRPSRR